MAGRDTLAHATHDRGQLTRQAPPPRRAQFWRRANQQAGCEPYRIVIHERSANPPASDGEELWRRSEGYRFDVVGQLRRNPDDAVDPPRHMTRSAFARRQLDREKRLEYGDGGRAGQAEPGIMRYDTVPGEPLPASVERFRVGSKLLDIVHAGRPGRRPPGPEQHVERDDSLAWTSWCTARAHSSWQATPSRDDVRARGPARLGLPRASRRPLAVAYSTTSMARSASTRP